MTQLTILTPVAPDHLDRLPLALTSVAAQTAPVMHLLQVDTDRRGPGWVRNRLLERVTTEYVTFLDADDWLAPTFAARTLAAIRPGHYIYTDWWRGPDEPIRVPPQPWCRGSFHLIAALVRTADARAVGGFDETLDGMEDTDFYLKLMQAGVCGWHLRQPLVYYRPDGGRAAALHASGAIDAIKAQIDARYGGVPMGCCGDYLPVEDVPVGERQPGDVLAMAQWGGNRTELGRATGRRYPRTSYPKTAWVDPRDVAVSPQLWQTVPDPGEAAAVEGPPPFESGVDALTARLMDQGFLHPAPPPLPARPAQVLPAVRRVRRLAGAVDLPTFVAPRQDYPSFRDFWRLVDLAGFETLYADEIDLSDPTATYLFSGPADLPDCREAAATTVFWQLEYAGEYTEQAHQDTVDAVWCSDPAYAAWSGAQYVLLGSHRGLNPDGDRGEPQYDLTMLAYLTDRRRALQQRLQDRTWAPDYPGHGGSEARHVVLRSTRLMLHAHQHDTPYLTPLRLALAAAYHLPVISEDVPDRGPYAEAVLFTAYDNLPSTARLYLDDKLGPNGYLDGVTVGMGEKLYQLLCLERPFGINVLEALGQAVPA